MKILEVSRSYFPTVGGLEIFLEKRFQVYKYLGASYKLLTTDYISDKLDFSKDVSNIVYLKQYTPYNITPSLNRHLTNEFDVVSVNSIGRYISDYAINNYFQKKPIILTPHFTFHTDRFFFLKKYFNNHFAKSLLDKVTLIIALTDIEKRYWMTKYSISSEKICVIPHFIERVSKKDLELQSDCKYLLYLGRYDKNKNLEFLLEIFMNHIEWDINLKLTVNINSFSNKIASDIRKDGRISCLGFVTENQKKELIKNSSAIIYPSRFEAFGHSLLEASAYAKPIICSDIDVFKEILDLNGAVYFQNTTEGLENAINYFLLKDSFEKIKMGLSNYENLSRYSFENISKMYQEVFNSITHF